MTSRGLSRSTSLVLLFFVALLCAGPAAAQGQRGTKVEAFLSTAIVKLGGTVTLEVSVEGARSADIVRVPKVDGLQISAPGRPVSTQYSQFISGRTYRKNSIRWSIQVRPERVGDFTIPPVELSVNGERQLAPADPLALRVVLDMDGDKLGFFEAIEPPTRVFEGEPFTVDLRFGWDSDLKVGSAALYLPWWGSLPGALEVSDRARNLAAHWIDVKVNRRATVSVEQLADLDRGGRAFRVLRFQRRLLASRSGTLSFPQSTFEFSEIVERGFAGNRLRDYYALLPGFEIEVLPVPEAGRPLLWSGAVGQIEAARRVDRRDVDEGDSIKLSVTWSGPANLEFFDVPDLARIDAFSGFLVLGVEDEARADERRVTYDIVPISSDVEEIPPVPLWSFDTRIEAYRKIETDAVPIRVRRLERGTELSDEEGSRGLVFDVHDIKTEPLGPEGLPLVGSGKLAGALFGVPFLWLLGRVFVRRRAGDPNAPLERKRRVAPAALRRGLARCKTASDQAHALHAFLAARTREGEQAWLGRDALEWREVSGASLDADAARELNLLLRELDERTYAGDGTPLDTSRVRSVAERLVKGGL